MVFRWIGKGALLTKGGTWLEKVWFFMLLSSHLSDSL